MTIRVMLADDHAVVRAGYRFLLDQTEDLRIIAEAEDSDGAYQGYFTHRPDVLVLDLSLPGAGGLTVIRRVISRDPDARVLVFTMHEEALYAKRALEAGAKGYIAKNADPDILPEAIRRIAEGQTYVLEAIASQLGNRNPGNEDTGSPLARLTQREFEIFCLAAEGLSVPEIAARLYISHKTAANHMTQIKRKLGVATVGELVRLAYRHNLATD